MNDLVLNLLALSLTPIDYTAAARLAAYNLGTGLDYTQTEFICIGGLNCHQLKGLKGDDSMMLEVSVNAWMQAVAPASLVPGCTPPSVAPPEATPSSDSSSALNIYLVPLFLLLLTVLRAARSRN